MESKIEFVGKIADARNQNIPLSNCKYNDFFGNNPFFLHRRRSEDGGWRVRGVGRFDAEGRREEVVCA